MFDFQDIDASVLHLVMTVVRRLIQIFTESDPDETEVEPNP